MPVLLILGNSQPLDADARKQAVHITLPEGEGERSVEEVFAPDGAWSCYARPGARPRWVACDDPGVVARVVEQFPDIEVRPVEVPAPPVAEAPLTADSIRELVRETVLATLAEQKERA